MTDQGHRAGAAQASRRPRVATSRDAAMVTALLTDAFAADVMWGPWAFPEPESRQANRAAVFGLLVQGAMRFPWAWIGADDAAATLWIPPGCNELSHRQEQALDRLLWEIAPATRSRILQGFEMIEAARPIEEHYYLTLFGSDPARTGRGHGQALLRHNLALLDAEGVPAYLEADDALVPLYRRHGFTIKGRFVLPDGPAITAMWRPPGAPAQSDLAPTADLGMRSLRP